MKISKYRTHHRLCSSFIAKVERRNSQKTLEVFHRNWCGNPRWRWSRTGRLLLLPRGRSLLSAIVLLCRRAGSDAADNVHGGAAQVRRSSRYHDLWQRGAVRSSLHFQSQRRWTRTEVSAAPPVAFSFRLAFVPFRFVAVSSVQ